MSKLLERERAFLASFHGQECPLQPLSIQNNRRESRHGMKYNAINTGENRPGPEALLDQTCISRTATVRRCPEIKGTNQFLIGVTSLNILGLHGQDFFSSVLFLEVGNAPWPSCQLGGGVQKSPGSARKQPYL